MRSFTVIVGLLLMASLSNAAVVPRRIYRNTQEILVPVAIIQDGEEIKDATYPKEDEVKPQFKRVEIEDVAQDIAKTVEDEQKLEAVEAVVQAQRRLDEAIVEEKIKEAIQEEQNKEIIEAIEQNEQFITGISEIPQAVDVIQPQAAENPIDKEDKNSLPLKSDIPAQNEIAAEISADEVQPENVVRQVTQSTPTQTPAQQNFVQQFIQNTPLGQFFNQFTGQTPQGAVANDDAAASAPSPGLFNPVNAVQSVVNTTTQAFAGLQQFASNLGNQFQSTLSSLGGQPQGQSDIPTPRPPGPIQQFVNTFMGNNPQNQPAPTQQGPLQGLINIFQANNRPQGSTNIEPNPAKEPEIVEQIDDIAEQVENKPADESTNEVRSSSEVADSLEESVKPEELIVVNDDVYQTPDIEEEQEISN